MTALDYLDELLEQPQRLEHALQTHLEPDSALAVAVQGVLAMRPRRIVLTGMGSSLFAAYPAYLRLLGAGLGAIWIELSEVLHYAAGQIGPDTLLVIVSQSGESVEALRLLEDQRQSGAVLAVTNAEQSSLARYARWVIPTGAGPEQTVATKTYSTALLALELLSGRIAGATPRELEAAYAPAVAASAEVAAQAQAQVGALPPYWLDDSTVTVVGRGPALSTALSAGLLFKESAKMCAEGLSSAQFRHGPLEIAGAGHRAIICTVSGPTLDLDWRLADELRGYGSQVLLVGPEADQHSSDAIRLPAVPHAELFTLLPLQVLARAVTLKRGIDPGSFRYIGKVTTSE
jgi:glucosamine--fructose-6-phosphate aminotransferase (isomerizing)